MPYQDDRRMTFQLYIGVEHDAFQPEPGPELARILRDIAAKLDGGDVPLAYRTIFDANGNDCGRYAVKPR